MSNDPKPASPQRRSNRERTEGSKAALLDAARALFVEKGFASTATPDIVAAAGLTRGALYHHFDDKTDLFRAVVLREAEAVALAIEQGTTQTLQAGDALFGGIDAYFDSMTVPGRARLLLLDAPAVLGPEALRQIDAQTGQATLRDGLASVLGNRIADEALLDALADVLSAAFDRAALAIASGQPAHRYQAALRTLLTALVAPQ